MDEDDRIPRFDVPTIEQLAPLEVSDEVARKIIGILSGELNPCEASDACAKWVASCYNTPDLDGHEVKLEAINDLLDMHGVEALTIDGADDYTDEGIRLCPPFSYANAGDPYTATILRDHADESWMVACYEDVLEEFERENEESDDDSSDDDDDEQVDDEEEDDDA